MGTFTKCQFFLARHRLYVVLDTVVGEFQPVVLQIVYWIELLFPQKCSALPQAGLGAVLGNWPYLSIPIKRPELEKPVLDV